MELAARYAVAIGVTALAMAWLGPAGSLELMTPANRALFWFIAVSLGWLQMMVIARGIRSIVGPDRFPGWVVLLIVAAVGAVPLTFEVRALWAVLRTVPGDPVPIHVAYTTVFTINTMFCLVMWSFVERWQLTRLPAASTEQTADNAEAVTVESSIATVNQLKRKPDGLAGQVLCLASEDHYLRVYTSGGSDIVLYRLSDAIADLENADGMQVHRSWWVARHAVESVNSVRGRHELKLRTGITVPVGRSFAPRLREVGWV